MLTGFMLKIDGITFGQSNSQLRFAGKLTGLYPSDNILGIFFI